MTAESGKTIWITPVGYRPERVVVDGAARLAVILKPDNLTRREKITVTVDPFEATLTRGEIKNLSRVLADDPWRAVQSLCRQWRRTTTSCLSFRCEERVFSGWESTWTGFRCGARLKQRKTNPAPDH